MDDLREAALTELEKTFDQLPPEHMRWRVMRASALLRLTGDAALDRPALWEGVGPSSRVRAFAYAAATRRLARSRWRGEPPTPKLAAAIKATLAELPEPWPPRPELGLALWAGMSIPLPGESYMHAQAALELAIQWGVPPDPLAALEVVVAAFGANDINADLCRTIIVKSWLDAPRPALAVAETIVLASFRLQVLFELAVACHDAGARDPAIVTALGAAADQTIAATADEQLWPGALDVHSAALRAYTRGDFAYGAQGLKTALGKLEGGVTPDARVRIYRLALIAAPLVGIGAWTELVEKLLADRDLLKDQHERANLLFEVAASTAHFSDPATRSIALGQIGDLARRIPDAGLRGLVCAELALRTIGLQDRSPASWLGEAKKAVQARAPDAPFLGHTMRLLAETDAPGALAIARALPQAHDRALALLMVAEVASGVTDA